MLFNPTFTFPAIEVKAPSISVKKMPIAGKIFFIKFTKSPKKWDPWQAY
jgi:hypothetical protein